ncbi:MAG: glycoside hydrolase family 5, partial [Candidatus Marinimicrobia bacterium]|nr:glycoside hydrolase family 5 [Candidatus Neomarinimicrobiota bacterium]
MKKLLWMLLVVILFFIQYSFAYLHTQGKEIVDSNGNPVLLRGIGLGGWLVPEGYMLHIPGYGSPTSIRNRIVDLIGEADTEQFYEIYRANYVNEEDIILIAEWGFNSIRLPFNYRLLSPEDQPGVFLEEGFQVIDSLLIWCERN